MRPRMLLVAAVLLSGCGGTATTVRHDARESQRQVAATPAKPIATTGGSEPRTHAGLLSLRRDGSKVVTAKVRLWTTGGLAWRPRLWGDGMLFSAEGLRLIDEVNGREHFPLESVEGECLCSSSVEPVERGESIDVYAKFPAPPVDVTRMSLHVPTFPSFDDVLILP